MASEFVRPTLLGLLGDLACRQTFPACLQHIVTIIVAGLGPALCRSDGGDGVRPLQRGVRAEPKTFRHGGRVPKPFAELPNTFTGAWLPVQVPGLEWLRATVVAAFSGALRSASRFSMERPASDMASRGFAFSSCGEVGCISHFWDTELAFC